MVPASAPKNVQLPLGDAVDLATAWAAALAERLGIRALVLKGGALAHHGLREARLSADVDLLVEPGAFGPFCAALERAGWRERVMPFINTRADPHSVTFLHNDWPCDIDVHHRYPGFLEDEGVVFEELWNRRERLAFAHVDAEIPDRLSSLLVMGLHALRDGAVSPRHRDELDGLESLSLTDDERAELSDLAVATGCAGTLAEPLLALGAEAPFDESPALRAWRARVASASQGAYPWLVLWRSTPWRGRLALAWRAFWPTDADILAARPQSDPRRMSLLEARAQRWARGMRGLPVALRALRYRHVNTPAPDVPPR